MNLSIWKNFPTKLSPASRNSSNAFAKKQSGTQTILAGRFCRGSPRCCEQPEHRVVFGPALSGGSPDDAGWTWGYCSAVTQHGWRAIVVTKFGSFVAT